MRYLLLVFTALSAFAQADLEVKTTSSALSLTPGSELSYVLTVTNLGALDAQNVTLSDWTHMNTRFVSFAQTSGPAASILTPLPGGYGSAIAKMATLPAHTSATFTLVLRVDPAIETAVLFNEAIVESDGGDPYEHNNSHRLVVLVGPDADLAIASVAPSARGTRFPVTMDVANHGPQVVKSVSVDAIIDGDPSRVSYLTVTPSQGTCSEPELYSLPSSPPQIPYWRVQCVLGTLAPGAKATITAVVDTSATPVHFKHIAFVHTYNDPNLPNNSTELVLTNNSSGRMRAVRK